MSALTGRQTSSPSRIGNSGAFDEWDVSFAVVAGQRSATDRPPVVADAEPAAGRAMNSAHVGRRAAQFDRITWELHGGLRYAERADLAIREEHMVIADMTRVQQVWGSLSVCGGGGS